MAPASRSRTVEERDQRCPVALGGHLLSEQLGQSRKDVHPLGVLGHHHSYGAGSTGMAHDARDPVALLEESELPDQSVVTELLAVVGGDHHQCLIEGSGWTAGDPPPVRVGGPPRTPCPDTGRAAGPSPPGLRGPVAIRCRERSRRGGGARARAGSDRRRPRVNTGWRTPRRRRTGNGAGSSWRGRTTDRPDGRSRRSVRRTGRPMRCARPAGPARTAVRRALPVIP